MIVLMLSLMHTDIDLRFDAILHSHLIMYLICNALTNLLILFLILISESSSSDEEGNVAIKKSKKLQHNPMVQGVCIIYTKTLQIINSNVVCYSCFDWKKAKFKENLHINKSPIFIRT
jgi:hypothetical protein